MTVSAKLQNDMVMSLFHNYGSKIPPNGVLSRTLVCLLVHLALADLRRKGAMEACPTLSVQFFFQFHAVFGKNGPNNRLVLVPLLWEILDLPLFDTPFRIMLPCALLSFAAK